MQQGPLRLATPPPLDQTRRDELACLLAPIPSWTFASAEQRKRRRRRMEDIFQFLQLLNLCGANEKGRERSCGPAFRWIGQSEATTLVAWPLSKSVADFHHSFSFFLSSSIRRAAQIGMGHNISTSHGRDWPCSGCGPLRAGLSLVALSSRVCVSSCWFDVFV